MDFADEDFSKIWLARSMTDNGEGGGPTFVCMQSRGRFAKWPGMHSDKNWHYSVLEALQNLKDAKTDYSFSATEWCTGWSDIYYIPRHLWVDYIYLSAFFGATNSFHEMTIPTMLHIIDQSRKDKPLTSIITWIGDCYGGCCNRGGSVQEYLEHRCGHSMDYIGPAGIPGKHYESIDKAARTLGKPAITPEWKKVPNDQRDWSTFTNYLSDNAMSAYQNFAQIVPNNTYQKLNMPSPIPWNANGKEPANLDPHSFWYRMKAPRPYNITEVEIDDAKERQEDEARQKHEEPKPPKDDSTKDKKPPPKPIVDATPLLSKQTPEVAALPEAKVKVNPLEPPLPKSAPPLQDTALPTSNLDKPHKFHLADPAAPPVVESPLAVDLDPLSQVAPPPLNLAEPGAPLLNSVSPPPNVFQLPPADGNLLDQAETLAEIEPPL